MIIGYAVEGATDRAVLRGLKERWCPDAEMVEGRFRGSSKLRLRAEIRTICSELREKNADVMVFLTDADTENWREVKGREAKHVPQNYRDISVYGVPDRNIECWLAADREYLAGRLGVASENLNVPDPKQVIEDRLSKHSRESQITSIVRDAPIHRWISNSQSFEDFYDDVRDLSQRRGCEIRNEREGIGASDQ